MRNILNEKSRKRRERERERERDLDKALAGSEDQSVATAVTHAANVAEVLVKCQNLLSTGQVPDFYCTI